MDNPKPWSKGKPCPEEGCQFSTLFFEKLDAHLLSAHGIAVEMESFAFQNKDELMEWMDKMQKSTFSKYIRKGWQRCHTYYCNKSSLCRITSKGKGILKARIIKREKVCASRIKVIETDSGMEIKFYKTHTGHEPGAPQKIQRDVRVTRRRPEQMTTTGPLALDCPESCCRFSAKTFDTLDDHLLSAHGRQIEVEAFTVNDEDELDSWMKQTAFAKYVKMSPNENSFNYYCNKSSHLKTKVIGKDLENSDYVDRNRVCASRISVAKTDSGLKIQFFKTHTCAESKNSPGKEKQDNHELGYDDLRQMIIIGINREKELEEMDVQSSLEADRSEIKSLCAEACELVTNRETARILIDELKKLVELLTRYQSNRHQLASSAASSSRAETATPCLSRLIKLESETMVSDDVCLHYGVNNRPTEYAGVLLSLLKQKTK